MIKVTPKKVGKKGWHLEIKNANGNIFDHLYNKKSGAKRAWNNFVKQVKAGKVKFIDE